VLVEENRYDRNLNKLKHKQMATDRLYVVNKETKEYCCIAKAFTGIWNFGNADILNTFLSNTEAIGNESDDIFYEKWIRLGTNINTSNKWVYFD
jgi:hypothetical protein